MWKKKLANVVNGSKVEGRGSFKIYDQIGVEARSLAGRKTQKTLSVAPKLYDTLIGEL